MTIGTTPVASLAKAAEPTTEADKIRKAASGFEAIFVAQLLRSARESSATEQNESGSAMMEVAEEEIARAISDQGGLGLSQAVVESLGRLDAAPPSARTLLDGAPKKELKPA